MSMKNIRGIRKQQLFPEQSSVQRTWWPALLCCWGGCLCRHCTELEKVFCTTHHCFAEAALPADTLPGMCDAEEHYLESTGLQPARSKLWPQLTRQVVKADYISGPAFWSSIYSTFPFSLWTQSILLSPVSKVMTAFHSTGLCFATFKSRWLMHRMDRRNTDGSRNTAELFPLPLCYQSSCWGRQEMGSCCQMMSRESCDWSVWGGNTQHCAVCVWGHEHLAVSFFLWKSVLSRMRVP